MIRPLHSINQLYHCNRLLNRQGSDYESYNVHLQNFSLKSGFHFGVKMSTKDVNLVLFISQNINAYFVDLINRFYRAIFSYHVRFIDFTLKRDSDFYLIFYVYVDDEMQTFLQNKLLQFNRFQYPAKFIGHINIH